jgi:hypothetical protein
MSKLWIVGLAALAGANAAQAAGAVQVRFVEPEKFTDVRDAHYRLEQNLSALQRVLVNAAAAYVPDGQTMTVEVSDVDLAGAVHPGSLHWPVRVLRGGADWPRITLRWTLDGATPRSGQAVVQDMDYLRRVPSPLADVALVYEQRMLRDYFRGQFTAAATH